MRKHEFLAGGGEMGKLMRSHDWSKTAVGPIDSWPQSLRTALSMVLNSTFPMFIWWGEDDLVNFYNDPYIAILGDKHPGALGTHAKHTWKEIWDHTAPLVDSLFTAGKSLSKENIAVTINRHGYDEEAYFTYSYSPIRDEAGNIGGMYCVCVETTEKVRAEQEMRTEQQRLKDLFMQAPAMIAIERGRDLVYELANPLYLKVVGKTEDIIGKKVKDVFPELKGQGILEILDKVYTTGEPFIGNELKVQLDVKNDGKLEDVYFNFVYQPSRNAKGEIDGILNHAVDVTEQVKARQKIEESEERYRTLFNSIDEGFCIIEVIVNKNKKPVDYCILETNPQFEKHTGIIDGIGKTAREIGLEQAWIEIYGNVALTGKSNRFTQGSDQLGKWFDVYASRIGGPDSLKVAIVFDDISERRQTEMALKESEERYKAFIRHSSEGIWRIELEKPVPISLPPSKQIERFYKYGYLAECNDAMAKMYGFKRAQQLSGKRLGELLVKEDENNIAYLTAFIESGYSLNNVESHEKDKNGEDKYFSNSLVGIVDDGKLVRAWGLQQDVSEQKKLTEQLKESEAYYREMTDNTPVMTWVTDAKGSCTYLNKQWYDFTGQSEKQALGYGWLDATHPDDAKQAEKAFTEANEKHKLFSIEYRLKAKDGNYRWVHDIGYPKFDESGVYEGFVGAVIDINERKLTEEELRFSQKETERQKRVQDTITANTPDLIYMFDLDYKFTYANKALLTMWGKTWDQAVGKGLLDNGYEPWHAKLHEEEIDKVVATKRSIRGEVSFQHATLGKRIYDYIFTPVINEKGEVEAVVGTTRDVTERVQAAKDLLEKQELESENTILAKRQQELMRLNKAKEEFIATASHQLRTPATAVKQYVGIVLDNLLGPVEAKQAHYLQIAYESNERQLTIINDLLKTAQIDSDKFQVHREPHNIVEVLSGAISDMKPTFELRNQTVLFDKPKVKLTVCIDLTEMKLVLTNLLENASKYSHKDSIINVDVTKKDHKVLISITDNGVGIDENNAKRVFDKFTRIDNELSDTVTGTGLGLYLVRQIVELHDGKISLKSKLGKGSTFTIELPLE